MHAGLLRALEARQATSEYLTDLLAAILVLRGRPERGRIISFTALVVLLTALSLQRIHGIKATPSDARRQLQI